MNRLTYTLLVAALAIGCSAEPAKKDLADFSFGMSQQDYEKQGFICNQKDEKYKFECANLDWTGSVLGQAVKGVRVGIAKKKGESFISVSFVSPPRSMYQIVDLHTTVDKMYTRLKDKDLIYDGGMMAFWDRPDGSSLKMNFSTGVSGIVPPSASFYVFDPS